MKWNEMTWNKWINDLKWMDEINEIHEWMNEWMKEGNQNEMH